MSYQNNIEEGDSLVGSSEVAVTTATTTWTSKKIIALAFTLVLSLGSLALLHKPLDMTPLTATAFNSMPSESTAYYNGRRYGVLGGANAHDMNYRCINGQWFTIPDGYVVKYSLSTTLILTAHIHTDGR